MCLRRHRLGWEWVAVLGRRRPGQRLAEVRCRRCRRVAVYLLRERLGRYLADRQEQRLQRCHQLQLRGRRHNARLPQQQRLWRQRNDQQSGLPEYLRLRQRRGRRRMEAEQFYTMYVIYVSQNMFRAKRKRRISLLTTFNRTLSPSFRTAPLQHRWVAHAKFDPALTRALLVIGTSFTTTREPVADVTRIQALLAPMPLEISKKLYVVR